MNRATLILSALLLLAIPVAAQDSEQPKKHWLEYIAWADARYQDDDATEETFFNLSQIYLSLRANLSDHWKLLAEAEYEN